MAAIKLGKLPNRAPIRLTVSLSPDLHRLLGEYVVVYHETYGEEESAADLIPFMLQAYIDGDREFARARRASTPRSE